MQVVTGVFKSENNAENAVNQLRSLGIPEKRIGIVRPGTRPERLEAGVPVTDTEEPGMGRAMGAAVGGAMGAAGGATAGLAVASLVVPGIGPLIAFGMVGAALLGTVGAAAGSAVGDSVEEELGEGIPHEDVYLYEDALRHGHAVVIAYVDEGDQADKAAKVIDDAGAEDLDTMRENWWQELREGERAHYSGSVETLIRTSQAIAEVIMPRCIQVAEARRIQMSRMSCARLMPTPCLTDRFRPGMNAGQAHRSRVETR